MRGKIAFSLLVITVLLAGSIYIPYPRARLSPSAVLSMRIMDRNGILLREVISAEGGRCRWAELDEMSSHVVASILAAEDRFFFIHPGVNVFSIMSAAVRNVRKGGVVSGASTLTQQLARNLYGKKRTVFSKIYETWIALRLEKTLSKEEILEQYLNRVCYGNMAYGIEAASWLYFDKSSADLSPAEAAFLSSLPRSPRRLNPYRYPGRAKKRQEHILERMFQLGYLGRSEWSRACREPLKILPASQKFRAPHFCDYVLEKSPGDRKAIRTTLDYGIQEKLEILTVNHLAGLESNRITNAAVLVLDNRTSGIVAMVGSRDFFDAFHDGQVNGSLSLRQPGSALKPFTYGLALEKGMTAARILEDREVHFSTPGGIYRPRNYDKRYHGPVRMRQALACSYNVPAVVLSAELGPDLLYRKLRQAGFQSLEKNPGFYGLGLTLGSGEVTLLELVQAYASLARGGVYREAEAVRCFENSEHDRGFPVQGNRDDSRSRRIFSPQTAFILTHMLSDNDARIPAFGYNSPLKLPFPCAAKTGTSKDCRDNWTVGYTPRYTVGVWVGNFDGSPMHNISGITGCGPLFRDVMLLLTKTDSAESFPVPPDIIKADICPLSGKRASLLCPGAVTEIFMRGTEPGELCALRHLDIEEKRGKAIPSRSITGTGLHIIFPLDGDVFKLDPNLREKYQVIHFKAFVPEGLSPGQLRWYLNGEELGDFAESHSAAWRLEPGTFTLQCALNRMGKGLLSDAVRFDVLR